MLQFCVLLIVTHDDIFSYYLCQIAFHFSKKVVIGQFAGRIVQVIDFNFHLLNFFKEIVHCEGCDKLGIMVVLNLLSSSHLRTNGINKTQCGLENYTASSLTSINGCIPHSRSQFPFAACTKRHMGQIWRIHPFSSVQYIPPSAPLWIQDQIYWADSLLPVKYKCIQYAFSYNEI